MHWWWWAASFFFSGGSCFFFLRSVRCYNDFGRGPYFLARSKSETGIRQQHNVYCRRNLSRLHVKCEDIREDSVSFPQVYTHPFRDHTGFPLENTFLLSCLPQFATSPLMNLTFALLATSPFNGYVACHVCHIPIDCYLSLSCMPLLFREWALSATCSFPLERTILLSFCHPTMCGICSHTSDRSRSRP